MLITFLTLTNSILFVFFFSSRRRHTRCYRDWSSDVCSSDLLGMKQVQENPWQTLHERYQIGTRVHGRVRNLTDFGAFIEIEAGVDGLVHVSDISWSRRIKHPSELLKKGQEIDAVITSIDVENRRLSLSIKDLEPNAWERFVAEHQLGDIVRCK